ncbi:hypothetical protein QQP08_011815 [Theobroma cacao]|nr:hypothetical protein QQP08_011815 [Theobroma cacao]
MTQLSLLRIIVVFDYRLSSTISEGEKDSIFVLLSVAEGSFLFDPPYVSSLERPCIPCNSHSWNAAEQPIMERLEDIQVAIRVRINGEAQCDSTKAWQSSNSGGIRIVSGNEPHQAPTNGFPIIGGVSDQVQAEQVESSPVTVVQSTAAAVEMAHESNINTPIIIP